MNVLQQYREIDIIKQTKSKKISLVKNEITQRFYIKRELPLESSEIYKQLVNISSPSIPKIHYLEESDHLIIIEDYINAPTLMDTIESQSLSYQDAMSCFTIILETIDLLHNQNPPIIHRDIKPENILYDHQHVYLIDFDISRNFDMSKQKDTHILGSVGYAAPEQFGFTQSDTRSDIYSLGVLLNVMLTGKLPSEELCLGKESKIIRKACHMDPNQRYQSAKEMLEEIKHPHQHSKYLLPGLNGAPWLKAVSSACYILWFLVSFTAQGTWEGKPLPPLLNFFDNFFMFSSFMAFFLVLFNYLDCHKYIPFQKQENRSLRFLAILVSALFVTYVIAAFWIIILNFIQ